MWKCHKCGKPVYFAERKQSLGYDWHPECLRCEECGKRLNPGQHAEHKGEPYCHIPCYSVLFGPTLFGHGSKIEAHTSFGKMEKRLPPGIDRAVLESKLKVYNQYWEGNSGELKWKERNGKLILEGILRIYWGVNNLIHLKENDDQRHHVQVRKRYSYREAGSNQVKDAEAKQGSAAKFSTLPYRKQRSKSECSDLPNAATAKDVSVVSNGMQRTVPGRDEGANKNNLDDRKKTDGVQCVDVTDCNNVLPQGDQTNSISNCQPEITATAESQPHAVVATNTVGDELRRETDVAEEQGKKSSYVDEFQPSDDDEVDRPRRERIDLSRVQVRKLTSSRSKTKLRRRCSINGHFYNRETKTFTPPYGSAANVWITSLVNTNEVINLLLDKFRVENKPEDFALYVLRDNGEIRRIRETEYPLLSRVLLGPHEDVAKVFIMDKKKTNEISNEVAQYINFQDPELLAILHKFYEEEEREAKKIKLKYEEMRRRMKVRLATLSSTQR